MKVFDFIDDPLLRGRIEGVRDDISDLGALLIIQDKERTKSCLRKTMIIYASSIY